MAPSGAADGCGAADDSVGVGVERRGGSHGRGAVDDGGALEWSHRRRRRRQLRPYSSLSGAGVASPASFFPLSFSLLLCVACFFSLTNFAEVLGAKTSYANLLKTWAPPPLLNAGIVLMWIDFATRHVYAL